MKGVEIIIMLENVNLWLVIIATSIGIIASIFAFLMFFFKLGGTLTSLNTSIQQLNEHLTKVTEETDRNSDYIKNHEIRLIVIERELDIKGANK